MATSLSACHQGKLRGVSRVFATQLGTHFELSTSKYLLVPLDLMLSNLSTQGTFFFITRKHPISAKKSFPNCRISQSLINPSANLKKQMRLVEPASLHPLVSGRPGWHETSCQVMQEDKSNWIKLVFSVWGCARIHNNTMSSCVA